MNITNEILKSVYPSSVQVNRAKYLPFLGWYMDAYKINTPLRAAMFLAQVGHESSQLNRVSENLNYSESGLLATFPKYFTNETAKLYAQKPEAIASRVYANRMDNGNEDSGDGWKYRGRGLIQCTGKSNYAAVDKALIIGCVKNPDLLSTVPEIAVKSAVWWWEQNGLNQIADTGDIEVATKRINGGLNGIADRKDLYARAKKALEI